MKCQRCGVENDHPIWRPVRRQIEPIRRPEPAQVRLRLDKVWECTSCGRYHWPDGSLYEPQKVKE